MTAVEQLTQVVATLTEEQAERVLSIIYTLSLDDEQIDEDGNVVVDEFYQRMLEGIASDTAPGISAAELYKELGIVP